MLFHDSRPLSISLVAATYNWPKALAAVLESVLRQATLPFEVLIADDGSGNDTRQLVEHYSTALPVPLVHVWQEDRGFRAAAARNRALARAVGARVVFIDEMSFCIRDSSSRTRRLPGMASTCREVVPLSTPAAPVRCLPIRSTGRIGANAACGHALVQPGRLARRCAPSQRVRRTVRGLGP